MAPKSDSGDGYDSVIAQLLLSDAELALTFTEIAAARTNRETIERTVRNARKAYNLISLQQHSVTMPCEDAVELDAKLLVLKGRLIALGERIG